MKPINSHVKYIEHKNEILSLSTLINLILNLFFSEMTNIYLDENQIRNCLEVWNDRGYDQ